MTKEEKIDTILTQLDDNNNLRLVLRTVMKNTVLNLSDEKLDLLYFTLNPPVEDPPQE